MNSKWVWLILGIVACLVLETGCNEKKDTIVIVDGNAIATVKEMTRTEFSERQKRSEALQSIRQLESAVDGYEMDCGKLPDSLRELISSSAKGWEGPYIRKEEGLKDPWGNEFHYTKIGNQYKIVSGGADGTVGDEDDVK